MGDDLNMLELGKRATAEGWVRPTEDTIAPDPTSQRFDEVAWTLRYGPHPDLYAASVMDVAAVLIRISARNDP